MALDWRSTMTASGEWVVLLAASSALVITGGRALVRLGVAGLAALLAGALAAAGGAVLLSGAPGNPAADTARTTEPVETELAETEPGEIKTADDLLAALETADQNLSTLTADLRYDRTFEVAGDEQTRWGALTFRTESSADGAPRRSFAILFRQLQVGDRVRDERQEYIFDGQWLLEKRPDETPKQYVKRQVVPPGERFDPLRIGEGFMPLPIGQRRADIVSRYDAELLAPDAGLDTDELREFAKGAYQLKLTPRADRTDRDQFREIRLWYRRGTEGDGSLLPRMARTVNRAGDIALVRMIKVKINGRIDATALSTATPDHRQGWDGQIMDWRGEVQAPGSAPGSAPASGPASAPAASPSDQGNKSRPKPEN